MQILYFNLNLGRRKGATEALCPLGMLEPLTVPDLLPLAAAGTLRFSVKTAQSRAHSARAPCCSCIRLENFPSSAEAFCV